MAAEPQQKNELDDWWRVEIEGERIRAIAPEGYCCDSVEVSRLFSTGYHLSLDNPSLNVYNRVISNMVWPDGLKAVVPSSINNGLVFIHESKPAVRHVRWYDDRSRNGREGKIIRLRNGDYNYFNRQLAFPYVITAIHTFVSRGSLRGTGEIQVFWRNEPLASIDDAVCVPAMLNVHEIGQKYIEAGDIELSCTMCNGTSAFDKHYSKRNEADRVRYMISDAVSSVLDSGFNTDMGEASYGQSIKSGCCPPIETVASWESASLDNPKFILRGNWIRLGPLRKAIGGILPLASSEKSLPRTARQLANLVSRCSVV